MQTVLNSINNKVSNFVQLSNIFAANARLLKFAVKYTWEISECDVIFEVREIFINNENVWDIDRSEEELEDIKLELIDNRTFTRIMELIEETVEYIGTEEVHIIELDANELFHFIPMYYGNR